MEHDEERQILTILVRVDDTQRGTANNLRKLKLLRVTKLEWEGGTFVLNKIVLINTISHPKGWVKVESLPKRLEKHATFMTNRLKTDFMVSQRKAR